MDANEMNMRLLKAFPNLADAYQKEVSWQEGDNTGAHVVYGDVFVPYFSEQIRHGNVKEVKNILRFIENTLNEDLKYSNEVIAYSVLESILSEFGNVKILIESFGPKTRIVVREMQTK